MFPEHNTSTPDTRLFRTVESIYQQIRERAVSEGIDLDVREVQLTAENIGELRAKTAMFSERGAFAPLVSSVCTKFHSSLLAMGIEIADLPGYTDTNAHLREATKIYSKGCPKAIFVADLSRCLTTPELKKSLKETIKARGAENVCLVLRGKEVCDRHEMNDKLVLTTLLDCREIYDQVD
jgi:hypothetical protein